MLIFSLITAGILSGKFSRPITNLNIQAKRIKNDEYEIDIQPSSSDEIGKLTNLFIEMSWEVRNRIQQLEESVDRERRLKDIQKSFLNSVTHEFKTPLTSIIGYSDLLKQYSDDPVLLEDAVRVIRFEGERLYHMVDKVLYLSRMEMLDFTKDIEEFNVQELIDMSTAGISLMAINNKITIEKDIQYSGVMHGDYDMLYRMMINLLDNAVKYNVSGGIVSISAKIEGSDIKISVKDTGMGIGSEHLTRIFEPFFREDKNRSKKICGDGLGLAIVKEIVEKHNGTVSIDSVKGSGTDVTVLLPV